jgi:hypothetical protein
MIRCSSWLAAFLAWSFVLPAAAFQVLPKVSDVDRRLASYGSNGAWDVLGQLIMGSALPMLKSPVHEAITLAAVGCNSPAGLESDCVNLETINANRVLLYGVRWPDDPPFRLNPDKPPRIGGCDVKVTMRSTAQPKCWLGLFKDAGVEAQKAALKNKNSPAFGPGDYLLYRSHYGDLQFIHSMGTRDGELASETAARMKMWARFLWGVAVKEIAFDQYIRTTSSDMAAYFPGDITPTNLFATGIVEVRKDLDQVALGAMLHMVQDSFSQAHARRGEEPGGMCPGGQAARPGKIQRFYSYAGQHSSLHDSEDTFDALRLHTVQSSPTVVDASRSLLTLWQAKAPWVEAEKVIDCFFELADPNAPAEAGPFVAQEPTGSRRSELLLNR